ncbi:unnamed protein product [Dovyalis caffra]|uniref:Uncharacterized protein n=1 Tax=Dovyalis caffra TaxID=77055 RepID=A0AAV1REJ6_9ROSI|nr:unnamed protein product [Dovyalis caffra]
MDDKYLPNVEQPWPWNSSNRPHHPSVRGYPRLHGHATTGEEAKLLASPTLVTPQ